jgi:Glyoxalase-like domain
VNISLTSILYFAIQYNNMKNHWIYISMLILMISCTSPKSENIDHIILAINNLDKGVEQFKALTGVEAAYGGIHPNSFTHNALVSLGGDTYLEIIAPRPDAQNVPEEFSKYDSLTPWGWAIRTRDIEATRLKLKASGFDCSDNAPGSRSKPDGALLSWTTMMIKDQTDFPFFIEWGKEVVHPSTSSPKGCVLKSLSILSANEKSFVKLNSTLNLGLKLSEGEFKIRLVIETPKGEVVF